METSFIYLFAAEFRTMVVWNRPSHNHQCRHRVRALDSSGSGDQRTDGMEHRFLHFYSEPAGPLTMVSAQRKTRTRYCHECDRHCHRNRCDDADCTDSVQFYYFDNSSTMGILCVGMGSALYLTSNLGPGPRDGLMTGLQRILNRPIGWVRFGIEVSVLVIGWILGGNIGIGTVMFAFGCGHAIAICLTMISIGHPKPKEA